MNNKRTDIIIQLVSRENQLYGLAASGKIYLLNVKQVFNKDSNKPVLDTGGKFLMSYDWELVIDSPEVK